jgi:hypothetical protein
MDYYWAERLAKRDFDRLKRERRLQRDKRRKGSEEQTRFNRYSIKTIQFSLALHRRGLRSPFDYEYPRFNQMSKLARELYNRHVAPLEAEWKEAYDG